MVHVLPITCYSSALIIYDSSYVGAALLHYYGTMGWWLYTIGLVILVAVTCTIWLLGSGRVEIPVGA